MLHVIRVLALLAAVGTAQTVQIRPRLVAGDEFRVEVTRIREDQRRPDSNYSTRTPVDVRVISADGKGLVIEWRPRDSEVEGKNAGDPSLAAAAEALGDIQFRIALTAEGEFDRLLNEDELRPKLQAVVDVMLRDLKSRPLPKEGEDLLRQVLSPANLINMASRDAQIYFGVQGLSLAVGDTLEAKLEQQTPLGGAVPAVFRARVDSATAETASITTTTTYDADALLKLTVAFLEKTGTKVPPGDLAKIRLDMGDEAKYQVDRRLGLVREMTLSRRQSMAGAQRLDRWTIRLVSGPKR
jgi:hypothetical protein